MTITGSYRDEDGTVVSSIVWALLVLLHSDCKWHQGGPNWAAWANGNSPYELALDAVCEKFGIEFDIEWKANCNDPVGVTIRRKEEQHCSDLRAQDTNQTATGEMRSAMKMICVEAKATPKRDKAIDDVVQKYPELWPQSLGEWEFNGKPVHSQYSYITPTLIGMKKTAGLLLTSRSATTARPARLQLIWQWSVAAMSKLWMSWNTARSKWASRRDERDDQAPIRVS
jgi:hypothetical protein